MFKMLYFYFRNTQGKLKLDREITRKTQGILLSEMSGNHVSKKNNNSFAGLMHLANLLSLSKCRLPHVTGRVDIFTPALLKYLLMPVLHSLKSFSVFDFKVSS